MNKAILITGGAGFIGSHVVKLFVKKYPEYLIVNFDKLTYAGNLENLKEIENYPNYKFIKGDIANKSDVITVLDRYRITDIINLAAESHVDRSINSPKEFIITNVFGTFTLLDCAKNFWSNDLKSHRFYHISTDEVYGALSLDKTKMFTETTRYDPHSPYSASKASSDHFVRAYHDTYGMNTVISNCSNNYGPNQFPEKLIPLCINNLLKGEKIPIYGTGENIRDWLYVEDHAKAIDCIFHKGKTGETYNIGGNNEQTNKAIVEKIIEIVLNDDFEKHIEFVSDRKGHDLRYAIDSTKLKNELGWIPEETFDSGMRKTVEWYLNNKEWLDKITSGEYKEYYRNMYSNR